MKYTPEVRLKMSIKAKERWSNIEEKKKQSLRTSKSQKKLWKNPIHRKRMILVRKQKWLDVDYKDKMCKIAKKAWRDNKRRINMSNRVSKENHPFWQGGKSFEEYGREFDNGFKEQIRFRDNYRCKVCGCPQIENGQQLDIHHLDRNKKNNNINNLITICRSCHIKLHWKLNKAKCLSTYPC